MRKMSKERRQIVVLAAVLASTSGTEPILLHGHPRAMWVWAVAETALLAMIVVKMVRLRRKGVCA